MLGSILGSPYFGKVPHVRLKGPKEAQKLCCLRTVAARFADVLQLCYLSWEVGFTSSSDHRYSIK